MKVRAISEKEFFSKTEEPPKPDNRIAELEKKLYFDSAFNIQNRAKFEEDLKALGTNYTYFSLDANCLKLINDTYSHEVGDEFLRIISECVKAIWGSSNSYKRGGDEYVVLIRNEALSEDVCINQIKKFKSLLEEEGKKHEYPVSASVGYATSEDANTLEEVMKLADEIMYNDKAAFKKLHPEFDTRRARITSESLQEAISNGDFHKAYKELRGNSDKEEKEDVPVVEVEDEAFSGVEDAPDEGIWDSRPNTHTSLVPVIQEDLSNVNVHDAEEAYQSNEFNKKVQPVLQETTQRAVAQAVRYQNDKLKLEVAEVLDEEVSYRLSNYEKRRRRRDFRERVSGIAKFVVTVVVILFILGNQQLRLRFALLFENLGDIFIGLVKGEEVESNKLVHDLFRDMGDELNEVNTIRRDDGFTIKEDNDKEILSGVDNTESDKEVKDYE